MMVDVDMIDEDKSSPGVGAPSTLVDVVRRRAVEQPERLAYTYLRYGGGEASRLTYAELDAQVCRVAARLGELTAPGDRALVLSPPGLGFVTAFLGCLYAHVVAVPTFPPRSRRADSRLRAIAKDSGASLIVTESSLLPLLQSQDLGVAADRRLVVDEISGRGAESRYEPQLNTEAPAFLQYTSGSTATPKGVIVTHANLLHNEGIVYQILDPSPDTVMMSWLPAQHDMGLIAGILQPLYAGCHGVLMAPLAFLRRPLRWLEAITHFGGTTNGGVISGGPNFAYDLCVRKVTAEQLRHLDLSCWQVAFNGAEPVRLATLERFARKFAVRGFNRRAFAPSYGLAEATLVVSSSESGQEPLVASFDPNAMAKRRVVPQPEARRLVGCGRSRHRLRIVDPESGHECPPDRVGEIWLASPSVARGYWRRPEETARVFGARIVGDEQVGPFLRTGDLGFLWQGELIITGRLKDLIIVRGRNHYPQDIETTALEAHPDLRPDGGAAFEMEVSGEEQLVLVHEVERGAQARLDVAEVAAAVRQAVAEAHELQVWDIVLIKAGNLPKTTSGKVQRRRCRVAYRAGELPVVGSSQVAVKEMVGEEPESRDSGHDPAAELEALPAEQRPARMRELVRREVARVVPLPLGSSVALDQPLSRLGLDSLMALELRNALSTLVDQHLPVTLAFEHPTVEAIAAHLLAGLDSPEARREGEGPPTPRPIAGAAGLEIPRPRRATTWGPVPLSHAQQAQWVIHKLAPESFAYHVTFSARTSSAIDDDAFRRATEALVLRHPSLRVKVDTSGRQPLQEVAAAPHFEFEVVAAQSWDEARLRRRVEGAFRRPFDLQRGPMIRVHLFHRSSRDAVLLLVLPHIACDGWSLWLLLDELGALYGAQTGRGSDQELALGEEPGGKTPEPNPPALTPLSFTYADYVHWQQELLSSKTGEGLWSYWRDELAGDLPVLSLPSDRPRPAAQTYSGASHPFRLGSELSAGIKRLARAEGVTVYTTLLTAFLVVLHRNTGLEDLPVGTITDGRGLQEFAGVVGNFINPVVIRGDVRDGPDFRQFLGRVQRKVLAARIHQDLPFLLLLARLRPDRDPGQMPLYQVDFVLQNPRQAGELRALIETALEPRPGDGEVDWGGLTLRSYPMAQGEGQRDLTLEMFEAESLPGVVKYNTDLFDRTTIARFADQFLALLAGLAAGELDRPLHRLGILGRGQRHQLLVEWNDTRSHPHLPSPRPDPRQASLHQLFTAQAENTPDAVAVSAEDSVLTYAGLAASARRTARALAARGAGPERVVALLAERSPEFLVAMLGILESGAAYLPLDPLHPASRVVTILQRASARLVLVAAPFREPIEEALSSWAGEHRPRLCALEQLLVERPPEPHWQRRPRCQPQSLAYIIFTSGSTGIPKGAMVEHRGMLNHLAAKVYDLDLKASDVIAQNASQCFDISVWQFLSPLLVGGQVRVMPPRIALDPERLLTELRTTGVSVLETVPSLLLYLLDEAGAAGAAGTGGLRLRWLVPTGEALAPELARRWLATFPEVPLVNAYGPTECSDDVTHHVLREAPAAAATSVLIGRPLRNLEIFVLGRKLEPMPVGARGELCVAGVGVGRGYRQEAARTATSFVPDPFARQPGGRMYRTGDLARSLADGTFDCLGRLDDQVKVRGYRIEPGEIEAALVAQESVAQAAVIVHDDGLRGPQLVACLVAAGDGSRASGSRESGSRESATAALRRALTERLPDAMVPAGFIVLDALPLNANGKVDRGALGRAVADRVVLEQAAGSSPEGASGRAPRSREERILCELFAEMLAPEGAVAHRVGVNDSFFSLGGDSIQSIQLVNRARRAGLELSPRDVFLHPTVEALAAVIRPVEAGGGIEADARAGNPAPSDVPLVHVPLVDLSAEQMERLEASCPDLQEVLPLSPLQEGLTFHAQTDRASDVYKIQLELELEGRLDVARLRVAVQALLRRHDNLRVAIHHGGSGAAEEGSALDRPVQVVPRQVVVPWHEVDLSTAREETREVQIKRLLAADLAQQFVFSAGPLLRFLLVRLGAGRFLLVFTTHHVLMDGWSVPALLGELFELYQSGGDAGALPRVRPYADYLVWLASQDRDAALARWRDELRDLDGPTLLALPERHDVPATGRRRRWQKDLSVERSDRLRAFARRQGLTIATVVQGLWAVLLGRLSGRGDVIFGATVAGRPIDLDGAEQMVGLFINTLPFRVRWRPGTPVSELLAGIQESNAWRLDAQPVGLAEIQRQAGHGQLFDTLVVFGNYPVDRSILADPELRITQVHWQDATHYPLTLDVVPGERLHLRLGHDPTRFEPMVARGLAERFVYLLDAAVASPDHAVERLDLLAPAERHQLLTEWNDSQQQDAGDHPGAGLHDLFIAQVARTPDAIAVAAEDSTLTYAELAASVHRRARWLAAQGAGPERVVALLAERSPDFLVAMLGILESGAAYLPLDPLHPAPRIATVLQRASAKLVLVAEPFRGLVEEALSSFVAGHRPQVSILERLSAEGSPEPAGWQPRRPHPQGLAYIIFTSGSTGMPKGAMVEHQGMVNHLVAKVRELDLRASDVVAQNASQCFDISVWQFLSPLLVGGQVRILPPSIALDSERLLAELRSTGISVLETVPSLLRYLLDEAVAGAGNPSLRGNLPLVPLRGSPPLVPLRGNLGLRWLMPTGEALPPELARRWLVSFPEVPLVNAYGPTECSDDVTHQVLRQAPAATATSVPIGRPLRNLQIYIVSRHLELVPSGTRGELCVAGVAVGRGYRHDAARTATSFVPDPFAARPGRRMYRTGDLAHTLADGTLDYLGRLDDQVKVRGYRIELGEIEATLVAQQTVAQAAVIVHDGGRGSRRLVACLVAARDGSRASGSQTVVLDTAALRQALGEQLPSAMVPAVFLVFDALPLSADGKVDRAALGRTAAERAALSAAATAEGATSGAPRSREEQILCEIFTKVLAPTGTEGVGIEDNFFDTGGDSILSLRIVYLARQAGLELTSRQIFEHQTIAELARVVAVAERPAEEGGAVTGEVSLTPIQRWFFEQEFAEPHHFNLALLLRLDPRIEAGLLAAAMGDLLAFHDALRLRFVPGDDLGWRQQYVSMGESVPLSMVDLGRIDHPFGGGAENADSRSAFHRAATQCQASLSLAAGPLLRAALFVLASGERRLLLVIHHLVVDGVSWRVLLEDLRRALEQRLAGKAVAMGARTMSFKSWAAAQQQHVTDGKRATELSYWQQVCSRPQAPLPSDFPDGNNTVASGRTVSVELGEESTRALLRDVGRAYRTRIQEVLLAALARTLSRFSGTSEVWIEVEGHGREVLVDADVSRTVGWFTSQYPVCLEADGETPGELLKSIKEQLRRIPGEGTGYGLLRYLSPDREVRKALADLPPPEVVWNYLGQFDELFASTDLLGSAAQVTGHVNSLRNQRCQSLEVNGIVTGGRLRLDWGYSAAIHRQETIDALARQYLEDLEDLITHCLETQAGDSPGEGQVGRYTPSDFPLAGLGQAALDRLVGNVRDVEGLYPVTPMQEGMLLRALHSPEPDEQLVLILRGEVDEEALERAWQHVVASHSVLRTSFQWRGLEHPLQWVRERVRWAVERQDWRSFGSSGAEEHLRSWLESDRKRGFEADRAPLLRVTSIRLPGTRQALVVTWQDVILDGWSLRLVLEDAMRAYRRLQAGQALPPEASPPFERYVAWLTAQDSASAETFWRRYLRGFKAATALPGQRLAGQRLAARQSGGEHRGVKLRLSAASSAQLLALARQRRLTLNTLVQGAWALMLSRYSGDTDVLFGVTASGRPEELAGTDRMVGLFINLLPLRVAVAAGERLAPWLGKFQQQQLAARRYEATPLAEILRWSELSRPPLFESLLVFENYSQDVILRDAFSLPVEEFLGGVEAIYPWTLVVVPGDELLLMLNYQAESFEPSAMARLGEDLQALLEDMAADPDRLLGELAVPHAEVVAAFARQRQHPSGDEVDRPASAVPQPMAAAANQGTETVLGRTLPGSPLERRIVDIWQDLLGTEQVGMDDNFLALGGHSLLIIRLRHRLQEDLGQSVPMVEIFQHPSVRSLAGYLAAAAVSQSDAPPPISAHEESGEEFPLSSMQERFWLRRRGEIETVPSIVPLLLRLSGALHVAALRLSLETIVRRHEPLRTVFVQHGGESLQRVDPQPRCELPVVDLSRLDPAVRDGEAQRFAVALTRTPIDLEQGPMYRAMLFRCAAREHLFFFLSHHVANDGWSDAVLARELGILYRRLLEGRPPDLPSLPIQYRHFARWQRQYCQGEQQLAYWREQLRGISGTLSFSAGGRPAEQSFRAAREQLILSEELSQGLRELSRSRGKTLFMTLLAAFKALLHVVTRQRDIAIGSIFSNREQEEVTELIGNFGAVLPLRSQLVSSESFEELLDRVGETVLTAHANLHAPIERIFAEPGVGNGSEQDDLPLLRVMFSLQNHPQAGHPTLPGLQLTAVPVNTGRIKHDLNVLVNDEETRLVVRWSFNVDLFDTAARARLPAHYRAVLERLVEAPDLELGALSVIREPAPESLTHQTRLDTSRDAL